MAETEAINGLRRPIESIVLMGARSFVKRECIFTVNGGAQGRILFAAIGRIDGVSIGKYFPD